jgi:hypothetical protein
MGAGIASPPGVEHGRPQRAPIPTRLWRTCGRYLVFPAPTRAHRQRATVATSADPFVRRDITQVMKSPLHSPTAATRLQASGIKSTVEGGTHTRPCTRTSRMQLQYIEIVNPPLTRCAAWAPFESWPFVGRGLAPQTTAVKLLRFQEPSNRRCRSRALLWRSAGTRRASARQP